MLEIDFKKGFNGFFNNVFGSVFFFILETFLLRLILCKNIFLLWVKVQGKVGIKEIGVGRFGDKR